MYDAIVVGAGFAGLAAAKSLKEQGYDNILILEARDRVGGRTKYGQIAGLDIDLGGMWLGPTQHRLASFAEQYQVRTYQTWLEGKAVYRLAGKDHFGEREDFDGLFSILDGLSFLSIQRKINKLSAPLDCNEPWNHPDAAKLDAMTVEQWLEANVSSKRLRSLFRLVCVSVFCAEANQMSMLFFLHYLKSGEGLEVLLSADEGGAQNILFHGGVHQIARKIAEELGDRLHLSERVQTIDWQEGQVSITTSQGSYQAKTAIVAVPQTLMNKISFSPILPRAKQALHSKLAMGSAIKYWIAYDKPFWRDLGFNGSILRDDVPCAPCFDATPPGQDKGIIAGFFDGNHAMDYGDIDQGQRRDIVIGMLAEHYGEEARHPIEYVDQDWTAEEWSGGCYGAYAAPGVYASFGDQLRRPVGPIRWAGTETSPSWTGYIDGAIQSGERAAGEVMDLLSGKAAA